MGGTFHLQLFHRIKQALGMKRKKLNFSSHQFHRFKTAIPIPKRAVIYRNQGFPSFDFFPIQQ